MGDYCQDYTEFSTNSWIVKYGKKTVRVKALVITLSQPQIALADGGKLNRMEKAIEHAS